MEELNVKSFFTRRRKWEKVLQIFSVSPQEPVYSENSVYLDVDKNGYIKRTEKVTISQTLPGVINASTSGCGFMKYIWSSQGRCARLKTKVLSRVKRHHHNRIAKRKTRESKDADETVKETKTIDEKGKTRKSKDVDETVRKTKTTDESSCEESDFEEGSDTEEEDDEKPEWVRPPRKVSKYFRYLYSDAYIEKRCSKKRSIHLKHFVEDIVLVKNNKSTFPHQTKNYMLTPSNVRDYENIEEEEDAEYIKHISCSSFTLGDFLPGGNIARTDSKDLLEIRLSKCNTEADLRNPQALESSQNTTRDEDVIISDIPCHPNTEFESAVEIKPKEVPVVIKQIDPVFSGIDSKDKNDDDEHNHNNIDRPSVILLSRSVTRPDSLRKDFKLNYKEAQCKPRRFIINITHLAHQHFVLSGKIPLRIIPRLDLSIYLVFAFVKESRDNAEEYRVSINTNLQFHNPESILAPYCHGDIVSIHEVMHKTISALDALNLNQIRRKDHSDVQDDVDYKAVHSFNSLTSVCKWNTNIMEHPDSLEWSDDLSSTGYLTLLGSDLGKNSNEPFIANVTTSHALLPKHNMTASNISKQGPHHPSICGICLQDFNENRHSFPLALCVCSHWFCETCWKTSFHLHFNKTEQNCQQLTCIEEGCTSVIDTTSLLSLLPLQVVRDYEEQKWKNAIETTPQIRLCSNPLCKRIIFAKTQPSEHFDQAINVTCSCFYQTCFACTSSPHWPLSCAVAKIYHRRLDALQHDKFKQVLEDNELPDIVFKGKPCPKCGTVNQAHFQFSGLKACTCGNVFCWSCGKSVNGLQNDSHDSCTQRFQIEDQKLKQRLNDQNHYWVKNGELTRWYKVALHHRQIQHPQVVNILYKMANSVADTIGEISNRGKHVGNVRQASIGWKNHFRKFAEIKLKQLQISQSPSQASVLSYSGPRDKVSVIVVDVDGDEFINDFADSPRSDSSMSSTESIQMKRRTISESPVCQTPDSMYDPLIRKAVSNIVNTKLELHHIIEHVAVLLEYSHTLKQPGKIIRSLERAEDLCTCLDLLLLPTHHEGSSRIIPSFLRLQTQIISTISNLRNFLRDNAVYNR